METAESGADTNIGMPLSQPFLMSNSMGIWEGIGNGSYKFAALNISSYFNNINSHQVRTKKVVLNELQATIKVTSYNKSKIINFNQQLTSPRSCKPISAAVLRAPPAPKMNEGSPQCGHLKQLMFSINPKIYKSSRNFKINSTRVERV